MIEKGEEDLEMRGQVETIQTAALLRLARIPRRVLETWGDLLSFRLLCKNSQKTKIFLMIIRPFEIIIKQIIYRRIVSVWWEREKEREREWWNSYSYNKHKSTQDKSKHVRGRKSYSLGIVSRDQIWSY